jgi:hypothetical protein
VYHKKLLERTITLVAHPRATLRRRPGPTKATRNGPQGGCRACDGGGGDGRCRALEAAIASPARAQPTPASDLSFETSGVRKAVRGAATSARRASRGGERDEARGGGRWAAVGLEATALTTAGLGAAAGARAPYAGRVGSVGGGGTAPLASVGGRLWSQRRKVELRAWAHVRIRTHRA